MPTTDPYIEERLARYEPLWPLIANFARHEQRSPLALASVMRGEFWELLKIVDIEVLPHRIEWWQAEWQRMKDGLPRHPLTTAMARAEGRDLATLPDIQPALITIGRWRLAAELESFRQLAELLDPIATLISDLHDGGQDAKRAWVQVLGADLSQQSGALVAADCPILPAREGARLQLVSADLRGDAGRRRYTKALLMEVAANSPRSVSSDAWLLREAAVGRARNCGRLRMLMNLWRVARKVRFNAGIRDR